MTTEIALTLGILSAAVLLLATERFRADLIGLLVLLGLALSRVITPTEAFSGFSNPAIITIWAMLIISAGLARTGVANWLGRRLNAAGGKNEVTLLAATLFMVALFSSFTSSTGIVVMMLPVVSQIAKKRGLATSHLLMPIAFGTLLGGTNTLISNASNLLANNALIELGLPAFSFFDFARVGLPVTLGGIAFLAIFGRRLMPQRTSALQVSQMHETGELFGLEERLFTVRLPVDCSLAGRPLSASRLGAALKLNVIGITRDRRPRFSPTPDTLLRGGDELLVLGRIELLQQIIQGQTLTLPSRNGASAAGQDPSLAVRDIISPQVSLVEVEITPDSPLEERTLSRMDFRKQYNANVLAIRQGANLVRTNFQHLPLQAGDRLLLQTSRKQLAALGQSSDFTIREGDLAEYRLQDRLQMLTVPEGSRLEGLSLAESDLADAFGLSVLGILRDGKTRLMPRPRERLRAGDQLVVEGRAEDVELLHGLQELEIIGDATLPRPSELETEDVGLAEMVISPHAELKNKTLHDIHFREHYGLNVLAIWRRGRAYRFNLREMPLHAGDTLLIHGDRSRIKLLAESGEFLVTSPDLQEAPRKEKALLAALIMLSVVASVGFGVLPIEIAAVAGAALMVLSRCLTMEEAQRSIHWPAIFLIAGMLPLGIAMENTGAAGYLGDILFASAGSWQTPLLIAVLFIASNLAAQFIPTSVVVVLISSVALSSLGVLAASPQAILMAIALGASLPFLTPTGHPANLLVMGPGGYRFGDYFRLGLPLTLLTLAIAVVAVPYYWP
ncbi:MAG: SLC13 family permease [Anaerolineales bacterium]|nr:MAG: SLC13 family permease [Anaerolineales bacterium]